jgi:hypothetical protein
MQQLTYDDTLRVLDSWYGRNVVVSILPKGSHWYVTSLAGSLPKRSDMDMEWLGDDLPYNSEGYCFRLAEAADGWLSVLQLVRVDFRAAALDAEGSLLIDLAGARVTIAPRTK